MGSANPSKHAPLKKTREYDLKPRAPVKFAYSEPSSVVRGFLSFTTSRHSIFVSVSLFFESRYSRIYCNNSRIKVESNPNMCNDPIYKRGVVCAFHSRDTVGGATEGRAACAWACALMRFPLDVVLSPTSLSIKMQASSTTARAPMRCYDFTASNASSPCVPALCPPAPLPSEHASELCKTADLTVSFQASRGPAGPFAELSIP